MLAGQAAEAGGAVITGAESSAAANADAMTSREAVNVIVI